MKKMYSVLAVTSTLAFLMLATSAFAVNNADTLDDLDSTDFALATHAHSTSDVTGLDAELAAKADQTDVDTNLATKADQTAVDAALVLKADQTSLDALGAIVATKANQASLDAVSATVVTKADQTALDVVSATVANKADMSHVHLIGNMAIVAISGGEYTSPVDAMSDIANWCGTPSASNPCLVMVMPGVYDIGDGIITMGSYTSLKGAERETTVIKQSIPGTAVIDNSGHSNISISSLTLEGATGIYNYGSSEIHVSDVKFDTSSYAVMSYYTNNVTVSDITATGVQPIFHQGGALSVNDARLTAACNGTMCVGVRAIDVTALTLNNLDIDVTQSGSMYSFGIYIHEGLGAASPVHEISNISIKSTVENDWHSARGISATSDATGAVISLRDIDIIASSPANGYEYGLALADYDVMNVRNVSSSASTAVLVEGFPSDIKIENSILGGENTTTAIKLTSANNVSIANTKLVGYIDRPTGTSLNCFNTYGANYTAVTCP